MLERRRELAAFIRREFRIAHAIGGAPEATDAAVPVSTNGKPAKPSTRQRFSSP